MFDPAPETDETRPPAFTPDSFAATRSLIALILNPKDFKTCMSSLERKLAAVARAEQKSAATVAAADEYAKAKHAELDKRSAEVDARADAVSTAEWHLEAREKRIRDLENQWKFVDENELVRRVSGRHDTEAATRREALSSGRRTKSKSTAASCRRSGKGC